MRALKFFFISLLLSVVANESQSQVSLNVNIGTPPPWGPVGYTEVRYYYLPDVEAYYDVQTSMFIYFGGGVWVHQASLPTQYRSYDLYSGYKVVMTDYHGDAPYTNFSSYKKKYAKGYQGATQRTIGEKPVKGNSGGNKQNGNGQEKGKEDHGHGEGNGKKK
jgi:hypothetical protein